ncbi:uncharacterized protein LOC109859914, partial [Pseudomyrmex gracilis]|uniref:uncharacterized protein LOC109859914 n=1 Tax=Pseudomyrmex gracilis TaxID=219809 RepID=UPI000994A22B
MKKMEKSNQSVNKSTNKPVQNETDSMTSPQVSLTESLKKCNLSFSINFDFNDVNSENSTDSENADLKIDISEVDNYEPSSKHKREAVEEASVLNEMEEEIERQLDAKAAKTNLTATNVKNILKHVIPYEHLMTMVQKWLQDTENDVNFGRKLTRAKAKELAAAKVNIPWPITTAQKASSEVQALIQEELPEDSSDEEYNPEHDKAQSDDEREVESTSNSDKELQPSISVNNNNIIASSEQQSSNVQYDPEGIFKIPLVPLGPTEEESISQRTRSKLPLSETSLQEIEQAFIPPDITADMIDDLDCELDEDWDNFLKEFTQPLTQDPTIEDDPEADPEYNILEDETDLLDKEELRTDKAVEVSRKEQYDLIAELLELTPMFSMQEEEQEVFKKKKLPDNETPPIENNNMNCPMAELSVLAEPELSEVMSLEQRLLLATQLRQHVQLMAQHFVMTHMHPEHHSLAKLYKQNLQSLRYLSNGPNSAFNAENLEEALKLVSTWENKFSDSKFNADFKKHVTNEIAKSKLYRANQRKRTDEFFPELEELLIRSEALMYPQLLPEIPFRSGLNKNVKSPYLRPEETLIALGIEQFLPFVQSKPRKFKDKKKILADVAELISQYLLPNRDAQGLLHHIMKRRASKDNNPIKHYFEKGCVPKIIHYITLENKLKAPIDQPIELLPLRWRTYLNNQTEYNNNLAKNNYMTDLCKFAKQGIIMSAIGKYPCVSNNHSLRNPIVNMLPKILPATLNPKLSTTDKIDNSAKKNPKLNISEDKEVLDNNVQAVETCAETNEAHANVQSTSKTNATDMKETQTDKSTAKLNTMLTRSAKVSQNSPQIRKTTPRLAKTRSAQNMKMMAQALGSKPSSNCGALKSKEKDNTDKNVDEQCAVSKVDNEDEIAELMLASTTIIKDPVNRKKAKQTREIEIIKRLIKAENPLTEEERDRKFAASYFQKLHLMLESTNPETFKGVIKLYLDYSEKLESLNNQTVGDSREKSSTDKEIEDNTIKKDILTTKLYEDVCTKLQNYPELCTDFLLFLKPHQAAMIGKSVEYIMLQKMNDFVRVAQIYFAKQPSRIAKMMQAITQLSSDPHTTLENVHAVMSPVFKGHPLVMDLFLQVLPSAKPPESLLAPHIFENLTCPFGLYDKNVTCTENSLELYENIELPTKTCHEDPYGGENCKCDCHNTDDPNLKTNTEHCISCGTRFLNGRIYLQTPEGLRPAKITFPGEDQEKLDHIARVSLKVADKVIPSISPKKRRKSSKTDPSQEDVCQKQCATKDVLLKENEDSEKLKPKRNVNFTLKTDQKKVLKRIGTVDHAVANKRMRMSQCRSKREKKTEEHDASAEVNESGVVEHEKTNELKKSEVSSIAQVPMRDNLLNTEVTPVISSSSSNNIDCESSNVNTRTANLKTDTNVRTKSDSINKPWTREEDMILLQSIKKEYSESSFLSISEQLENRTIDE